MTTHPTPVLTLLAAALLVLAVPAGAASPAAAQALQRALGD